MEFCRTNGYCISIDLGPDASVTFTYYDLKKNDQESIYVSAANKYEYSIIIKKNDKEKFLSAINPNIDVYSDEHLFEEVSSHFKYVSSLEDIKEFLLSNHIPFEPFTWVEFYD
ncbi:MAG: hypothetical protein RBQ95_03615 [Paracholeplasma sp.]|nr:hypothetical protein [Paracholeplasma sp.]MDY3195924.1 hypothetical protein [Paracholeplasma sp.]